VQQNRRQYSFVALLSNKNVVKISEVDVKNADIRLDERFSYPDGLYNFAVSGQTPGSSYYLVLPLNIPLGEEPVFRKYMGALRGWQDYSEDANNALFSAAAEDGACPEPGSSLFISGLHDGHTCVQLYIEDGGPNDYDGVVDGVVTDPGGVGIIDNKVIAPSANKSTIEINRTFIANREDGAIITVRAVGEDGLFLEDVTVVAGCRKCSDVTFSHFVEQGQGVYRANITFGNSFSHGLIEAVISNDSGSATVGPIRVVALESSGGGCTIAGDRFDISLFVMIIMMTLLRYRRKPH